MLTIEEEEEEQSMLTIEEEEEEEQSRFILVIYVWNRNGVNGWHAGEPIVVTLSK